MNNVNRFFLSVSVLSLSACGGSSPSGGSEIVTPTTEQAVTLSLGTFPAGVSVIDNGNETWTFSFPTTPDRILSLDQVGNSGIVRYRDGGTILLLDGSFRSFFNTILEGSTSSNSGVATYFVGLPLDSTFSVVELERSGATTFPVSGTADMTGKTALNFINSDGYVIASVEGEAEFTANFGGNISGRTFDLTSFGDAATTQEQLAVTFESTPISGGGFVGTSTATNLSGVTGDYEGIFVGPSAGEAIGGYSLTDSEGQRIEGIFIVE